MKHASTEVTLSGVPLSPGVAVGRACLHRYRRMGRNAAGDEGQAPESRRLQAALDRMIRHMQELARQADARLGSEEAGIFVVYRLVLEDQGLRRRLFEAVEVDGLGAEAAVVAQLDLFKVGLEAAQSEYLRTRAADISMLQRGLLDGLRGVVSCLSCKDIPHCDVGRCVLGNDHILVDRELSASLPLEVDDHTRGFLLERGGPNAHALILARALQLPAVGGLRGLPDAIPLLARILINGDTGEVVLNPSADTLARHGQGPTKAESRLQGSTVIPGLRVMANIGRAVDVHQALAVGAEGIGLYRTEIEPLMKARLLAETEQVACYAGVLEAMGDRPVCIRLLDLGGDKDSACVGMPREGRRGAGLLLAHPQLLRPQARALARAAARRPIHVLYPMIVDAEQFRSLRALFEDAIAGLPGAHLRHGVLFEVPAACLQARQILEQADFACIGTNDLIQFLFAEDRSQGGGDGHLRYESHPVLWGLIEDLSRTARALGRPLSLCGELASDPRYTARILQVGIAQISANVGRIAAVRRTAQSVLEGALKKG